MNTDLHQFVNVGQLLSLAGLVASPEAGHAAIVHGRVRIEEWTIGLGQHSLPRWVLRGVTISLGDRSIVISDDGRKIIKERTPNEL